MKIFFKKIYSLIPFKRELFLFLKMFGTPRESIYRHLHFKSHYKVSVNGESEFKVYNSTIIENEIFWEGLTGRWEKESMKLWIKLCKNASTIFDLGANTGVYSLVAKSVNSKANVYAFEPHSLFFDILQSNIELNNFDIQACKKAVSNFDGPLIIEDYSGNSKTISVESVMLDSFMVQNKIDRIDLMKIDVETHEPQVMEGFMKNISISRPTLLIEILNGEIADSIFNMVSQYEYLYFNIDENGGIRQTDRIEKSDFYNYLLCNKTVAVELGLI